MEVVDYTGAQAVSEIIKNSGLSKFIIYRHGTSRNSVPVFQCTDCKSPQQAIKAFMDWSTIAGNGNTNPYDMVLFTGSADQLDTEATPSKKEKTIRFTFSLAKGNYTGYGNAYGHNPGYSGDLSTIVENITLKLEKKYDEMETKRQFEELKKEIQELKEEQEFDDDADQLDGVQNQWSTALLGLINNYNNRNAPAINGAETSTEPGQQNTDKRLATPEQIKNINHALKILFKHDKQLDSDLLKMATLAETNKPLFLTLLTSLRSM